MSRPLLIAFTTELFLILITAIFLLQPTFIFPKGALKLRAAARNAGMILLSITFIWSVIFGTVLALHGVLLAP